MTLLRGRRSAPLLFQVVGLLAVTVVGTQAINVAVILSSPPPKPSNFLTGEVAEALSGELERDSTALATTTERLPPYDNHEDPQERDYRETLARYLNSDAAKLRVVLRAGRPGGATPPGGSPPPGDPGPADAGMPPPSILLGLNDGAGEGFAAAVQLPDGRWRVVRPRQDGWLAPWQERALAWFLGTALLIAPLGYFFARRMTAPIRAFAAAAEQLGRNPQGPPMKLAGSAEIGAAAVAFNDMQERLRRYVEDRTTMIGAIAHDLRTPLTRLAFRLEAGAPDDLRAKAAGDIAEMEAMITAALAFVRDASRPAARELLELRSLLESIADDMGATGADVTVDAGQTLIIHGDPIALRRLFSNLIVNAVKYAGARVSISLHQDAGRAIIDIEDEGPGLPDAELDRVFEPFYRAERSRSRETGGIGLGLAVVRAVALAHGGEVRLDNRPQGGLRARVILPL